MFLKEISEIDFDNFYFENRSFYQTSAYGTLMSKHKFNNFYVGFFNEQNTMVAASLILSQKIIGNFYFAYAPRGFLIDYNNFDLLKSFLNSLKILLNKKKILYLKIDPLIKHIDRKEKTDNLNIISNLKKLQFDHLGFNLYFESLKPRWNATLTTEDSITDTYNKFDRKIKNKIQNSITKGVIVEKEKQEDISTFYSLIDKKHTRKIEYYNDLYKIFKTNPSFEIYYAKINTGVFLQNFSKLYQNELNKNELILEKFKNNKNEIILNKKIESDKLLNVYKNYIILATKLLNSQKNEVIIAANAVIKYNKEVFFLIDGINNKYKNFNANYLLKWEIIKKLKKEEFNVFNFNAISGNFEEKSKYYNLYEFKKGFNTDIIEYIGEFNIIINKFRLKSYIVLKNFETLLNPNLRKR